MELRNSITADIISDINAMLVTFRDWTQKGRALRDKEVFQEPDYNADCYNYPTDKGFDVYVCRYHVYDKFLSSTPPPYGLPAGLQHASLCKWQYTCMTDTMTLFTVCYM